MNALANRILRDDLLAQLRTSNTPLTTAELRRRAPRVPAARIIGPVAPLHEHIYGLLCGLQRQGLVIRTQTAAVPSHGLLPLARLTMKSRP